MELPSRFKSLSRSKLVKVAIIVAVLTILWNIAEGIVSVFFGTENESVSLVFSGYGPIQLHWAVNLRPNILCFYWVQRVVAAFDNHNVAVFYVSTPASFE